MTASDPKESLIKDLEDVVESVDVDVPPEIAFQIFVDDLQKWWPSSYTLSKDVLVQLGIEKRLGGLCFEIGPHGFRCDWGRVTQFEPGVRLSFLWQLNRNSAPEPDPNKASRVAVWFAAVDVGTRVVITHTDFHKHGDGAAAYRDEFASEYGWPFIVQSFQEYCNRSN